MLWKSLWAILSALLFAQFSVSTGETIDGHAAHAAVAAGAGAGSLFFGWLAGFKDLLSAWIKGGGAVPVIGGLDPAEVQTAIVELKDLPGAVMAVINNPRDFSNAKNFCIQTGEAQLAVGDVFIDDPEWSAAAKAFLALTKSKLDVAAPKTAAGKIVPPGMVSFAEVAR